MTLKQRDYIKSLIQEREVSSLSDAQVKYLSRIEADEVDPDSGAASRIIETLLALPRRDKRVPGQWSPLDVPAGRYALVHPERSHVEFFVVDQPTEGKWAGRTFVNQQAGDERYPVKGQRAKEVLARIAVDPQAAMIRYGHELGRCGNCGRTLTDEVSRAMGIGPDCAAKLGIERISVEEAVTKTPPPAPEAAPTVSTDKQGVPHAVGGWRARKRYAETHLRGEERTVKPAVLTQIEVLPGESWEDIFGGAA
jgi:Family of unknown function (DUF6011)